MIEIVEKKNCSGCNACFNICPKNAIKMKSDKEGFQYPIIDLEKCINCGACERVCPVINQKKKTEGRKVAIAAYSRQEENREESSSGGIFEELAKKIFEKGGIVYGAGFDEYLNVVHKPVKNIQELQELKGSKYVQSDTKTTFGKVKELLEEGRTILYTGTGCQIAGLKNFLKKDYTNLYTCDIICHGVPSPKIFQKYKEKIEEEIQGKTKDISFRNKANGWNQYSIQLTMKDGQEYRQLGAKDPYIQLFAQNYTLRPSCYECKFKGLDREADLTLGDFWGVEKKYSEFSDDKGTSLILVHSKKGEELFEKIKNNLVYQPNCDLDFAIQNNPCIVQSVKINPLRENFFNDFGKMEFDELSKKYLPKENHIKKFKTKVLNQLSLLKRKIIKNK